MEKGTLRFCRALGKSGMTGIQSKEGPNGPTSCPVSAAPAPWWGSVYPERPDTTHLTLTIPAIPNPLSKPQSQGYPFLLPLWAPAPRASLTAADPCQGMLCIRTARWFLLKTSYRREIHSVQNPIINNLGTNVCTCCNGNGLGQTQWDPKQANECEGPKWQENAIQLWTLQERKSYTIGPTNIQVQYVRNF